MDLKTLCCVGRYGTNHPVTRSPSHLRKNSRTPNSSADFGTRVVNLLNPTGHVMHQQFNIQQLCVLPTMYLCVLHLSENKQRLVQVTA